MKNKWTGFIKKNIWTLLFALFICVGMGISATLSSGTLEPNKWNPIVTHAPSTPTMTLVPADGWWTKIATPTP
jgi:hypothetical protein